MLDYIYDARRNGLFSNGSRRLNGQKLSLSQIFFFFEDYDCGTDILLLSSHAHTQGFVWGGVWGVRLQFLLMNRMVWGGRRAE